MKLIEANNKLLFTFAALDGKDATAGGDGEDRPPAFSRGGSGRIISLLDPPLVGTLILRKVGIRHEKCALMVLPLTIVGDQFDRDRGNIRGRNEVPVYVNAMS